MSKYLVKYYHWELKIKNICIMYYIILFKIPKKILFENNIGRYITDNIKILYNII